MVPSCTGFELVFLQFGFCRKSDWSSIHYFYWLGWSTQEETKHIMKSLIERAHVMGENRIAIGVFYWEKIVHINNIHESRYRNKNGHQHEVINKNKK